MCTRPHAALGPLLIAPNEVDGPGRGLTGPWVTIRVSAASIAWTGQDRATASRCGCTSRRGFRLCERGRPPVSSGYQHPPRYHAR